MLSYSSSFPSGTDETCLRHIHLHHVYPQYTHYIHITYTYSTFNIHIYSTCTESCMQIKCIGAVAYSISASVCSLHPALVDLLQCSCGVVCFCQKVRSGSAVAWFAPLRNFFLLQRIQKTRRNYADTPSILAPTSQAAVH